MLLPELHSCLNLSLWGFGWNILNERRLCVLGFDWWVLCSGRHSFLRRCFSVGATSGFAACDTRCRFSSSCTITISPVRFVLLYIYRTDDALENAKLFSPSMNCDPIYLPPSLWPITVKNRYTCKFWSSQKNESKKQADSSEDCRRANVCLLHRNVNEL